MSSDMLTNLLNKTDKETKPIVYFYDFYEERWEKEVKTGCDINMNNGLNGNGTCRWTNEACSFDKCYRRSKFHVNY